MPISLRVEQPNQPYIIATGLGATHPSHHAGKYIDLSFNLNGIQEELRCGDVLIRESHQGAPARQASFTRVHQFLSARPAQPWPLPANAIVTQSGVWSQPNPVPGVPQPLVSAPIPPPPLTPIPVWLNCRPLTQQEHERSITVCGVDVGVNEDDKSTGIVILRQAANRCVEVIDRPAPYTLSEAVKLLPALLKNNNVDYCVLDSPLFPAPLPTPPPELKNSAGAPASFRPHDRILFYHNLEKHGLPEGLAQVFDQSRISLDAMYCVARRMMPKPPWEKGKLVPFAQAGEMLRQAANMPLINNFTKIEDKGILEGFPKTFYWPMLPGLDEIADFGNTDLYPKVDFVVLQWLLDPTHPARFWNRVGWTFVRNQNLSLALDNDHVICATSCALTGLLYARGQALAVSSRIPAANVELGHWLFPDSSLFQPWAYSWFLDRFKYAAENFPNAEISCHAHV